MTASVLNNVITTLIANLVIAASWYFSIPKKNIQSLTSASRVHVGDGQTLNNNAHIFFFGMSLLPYFVTTANARLAAATLCCLAFSACTSHRNFHEVVSMRWRVIRWVAIVGLTVLGIALALSQQHLALLPMTLSIVVTFMDFQKRLQSLGDIAEDNAIMRQKISELSARVRGHRAESRKVNAPTDRRAS